MSPPTPSGALGRQPIDPKAGPYVGKLPETGGTSGGSAPKGESPDGSDATVSYSPFENAEVKWLKADADEAKPALNRTSGKSPAVILFVGTGDANSCCAEFFERGLFTDEAIVKLTRASLIAVRIERTSDAAKPFQLKGPALVIEDVEGEEVSRFTACKDMTAASVLPHLREAVARTAIIREKGKEFAPLLAKAEASLGDEKVRECVLTVIRAQKEPRLPRALKEKLAALSKDLDDLSKRRLESARGWVDAGDPGHAWTLDKKIGEDWDGLPAATAARDAMKTLEQSPETKDKVRESRAQDALDSAFALAQDPAKKARAEAALKAIAKDFDGTKAASEARKLAAEMADPAWKPAQPAEGK